MGRIADKEERVGERQIRTSGECDRVETQSLLVDLPPGGGWTGGVVGRRDLVQRCDGMDPPLIIDTRRVAAEISAVAQVDLLAEGILGGDDLDGSPIAVRDQLEDVEGDGPCGLGIVVFDHSDVVRARGRQRVRGRDQRGSDPKAADRNGVAHAVLKPRGGRGVGIGIATRQMVEADRCLTFRRRHHTLTGWGLGCGIEAGDGRTP